MDLLEAVGAFAFSLVLMIALRLLWLDCRDSELDAEPGEYRNVAAIIGCNVLSHAVMIFGAWKLALSTVMAATSREMFAVALSMGALGATRYFVSWLRKRRMSDYWIIRYYVAADREDPDGPWRRWPETGMLSSREEAERALQRCNILKPHYHFGAHRLTRNELIAFQSEMEGAAQ